MPLYLLIAVLALPASPVLSVPIPAEAATISTTTPDALRAYARGVALREGLNADHFVGTIACESGFDPDAVGDQGTSLGLAQIHLPAHPDITRAEALDPYFSIDWMASQWQADNASAWTCWRQLYGS
jgi:hypothetical protein